VRPRARLFGLVIAGVLGWTGHVKALDISEWKTDGLCKAIALNGDIARNEAAGFIKRMVAAADRCGSRTIIVQRMPGGSVNDAIMIGEAIRSQEYVTATLPNSVCASACGLIYLGGVQRYWNSGARFIIHRPEIRVATPFKTVAEEDQAYYSLKDRLISYVAAMGGNPDYVDQMYAVGKDNPVASLRVLNRDEMLSLGLATQSGTPF